MDAEDSSHLAQLYSHNVEMDLMRYTPRPRKIPWGYGPERDVRQQALVGLRGEGSECPGPGTPICPAPPVVTNPEVSDNYLHVRTVG